jgi:signal transduction histidine kinase
LSAYSRQPHNFATYEVDFVQAVANVLAVAIARKATEEDVIASEAQLQQLNATLEQRVADRTAELARSNRDLDQFAYVASHDLKAPLRAIELLANFITTDAVDILSTASQGHLVKLRSRIKRMEKLLDDLLAYSRAGRLPHAPEKVETRTLVVELVEELGVPAGFTIRVDESLPTLVTARVPLEVVLRNLINNAVKHHTRPDGHVSITAQEQGAYIEFSVADDGPGIGEQYHARIFDLFRTLKPRDQVEGSGMGLAIVKKIVESQGGTIGVESSEGRGATFRFTWSR